MCDNVYLFFNFGLAIRLFLDFHILYYTLTPSYYIIRCKCDLNMILSREKDKVHKLLCFVIISYFRDDFTYYVNKNVRISSMLYEYTK